MGDNVYLYFSITFRRRKRQGKLSLYFEARESTNILQLSGILYKLYSWCSPYWSHLTICWNFSYLFELNIWHFMFQKYCFYVIYKLYYFTNLTEKYLRESFNTVSGFHFETKISISGSRAIICLHYKMKVTRLFFYHLKHQLII